MVKVKMPPSRTLRSLTLASVLLHSDSRWICGFAALNPNLPSALHIFPEHQVKADWSKHDGISTLQFKPKRFFEEFQKNIGVAP